MTIDDVEYWEFRETEKNRRWNYSNSTYNYFTPGEVYWVYDRGNGYYLIRSNYHIEDHIENINADLYDVIRCNLDEYEFHESFTKIL